LSDKKFISDILLNTRELSKSTAKVLRDLPKTGPRVITRGSETVGILIPPSGSSIESDIHLLNRLRLAQALAATQREATIHGSSTMRMEDIDEEIQAVRRSRKKPQAQ